VTDAQVISVGEILASARKKKRLRYKKLSSELNIDEIYLIALEEGNFDLIPGGEAYVKGFLRSYAKKLDLNPDDVIDNYLSSRKGSLKATKKLSPKNQINSNPKNLPKILLIATFSIIFLLFLGVIFREYESDNQKVTNTVETSTTITSNDSNEMHDESTLLILKPDENQSSESTGDLITAINSDLDSQASALPLEETPLNRIDIKVYGDCWLEVFNENKRMIYNLAKEGDEFVLNESKVKIIAGNFKNVEVSFNDKMVNLEDYANTKQVSCIVLPSGDCSDFRTADS
jgi:cytoskeleton protein RodZ